MSRTVTLMDDQTGRCLRMPVLEATYGCHDAIDVRGLREQMGYLLYDPGYDATASCKSAITYIDGVRGELMYRGYPIDQLAKQASFLEVAYLLLFGELPDPQSLQVFSDEIASQAPFKTHLSKLFRGFNYDAHPMAMMMSAVSSLTAFDAIDQEHLDDTTRRLTAVKLIATMPVLAAACYKHRAGQPLVYPRRELGYCGNLLRMLFAVPAQEFHLNPVAERALNALFIIHADHEQNVSTSTVRLASAAGASPYAAVSAGVACLWAAHGDNHAHILRQLDYLRKTQKLDQLIERAKDDSDSLRLMGFGHTVYKSYDPRAAVIKAIFHELLADQGINDPLMDWAVRLEESVLNDEYFAERRIYPNVDFYSAVMYHALGLQPDMFTVLFAVARTVGWVSQWKEMQYLHESNVRRPRQLYVGPTRRDMPPIKD